MNISNKANLFVKRVKNFFYKYWIDLLFYIYITFSLYLLILLLGTKFNQGFIAFIWVIFFIPIFILKVKNDKKRDEKHFQKYYKNNNLN